MEKGIYFYFGFDIDPETRAKMIKKAGFDCVITSADKKLNSSNGNIRKQIRLFKKYDLKLSSLHMAYNTEDLHYFWEEGKMGDKMTKNLIKDVKIAKKYGFTCVVVHLFGEYSELGKNRLLKVLQVCEKYKIPLAIENIDCPPLFKRVFEKIDNKYMKFCYDSGHNNVYDKGFDYLNTYGDKLITLHLHDNMGDDDSHTISRYGNIDWNKIAESLKDKDIILDYEMLLDKKGNLTPDTCLIETKKMADELENLINKARGKSNENN